MYGLLFGTLLQIFAATHSADLVSPIGDVAIPTPIAIHEMSLKYRYPVPFVSDVFQKNILLALAYMRGETQAGKTVDWEQIEKPFTFSLRINPGETVAFHDNVLPQYVSATPLSRSHFNSMEGFLSDGYLVGDGVCHLASLLGWAARDAKLDVVAPTNHDFAAIPEIPKDQGISIFSQPTSSQMTELQNLYIHNQHTFPVSFQFLYDGTTLKIEVFSL